MPNANGATCLYNVTGKLRQAYFDNIFSPYVVNGKANPDLIGKTMTFTSFGSGCDQRGMEGIPTGTTTMKITAIQAYEQVVLDRNRYMIVTGTAE